MINKTSSCLVHDNWYLQYPNGPYWLVPDYIYPYNPPINTPQPIKIWNNGGTSITTVTTATTIRSMIKPEVNILVNKNRTRVFNNLVYLNEGDFAIEIFNPNTYTVGAKFKLNGKYISTSHLIIYAGQRVVLDRYIETKDKFKFTVYEVEKGNAAVENAIKNNGELEVEFYQEQEPPQQIYAINEPYQFGGSFGRSSSPNVFYCANLGNAGTITNTGGSTTTTIGNNNAPSTLTSGLANGISADASIMDWMATGANEKSLKETGVVDKGGKSDQNLTYVNKTFAAFATFITKFKILPMSEKPIEAKDLVVHCTSCGHKAKKHHKFCSNCGTKIE
jgi:hypothetical protein